MLHVYMFKLKLLKLTFQDLMSTISECKLCLISLEKEEVTNFDYHAAYSTLYCMLGYENLYLLFTGV